MDFVKLTALVKKYRYVILILALGLVLMAIPGREEAEEETPTLPVTEAEAPGLADQLSAILSRIDGAGKVEVLLTQASGEETLYQTDDGDQDTVTVTDSQRNQTGLVRQVNPPSYLGAIVVCQGADSPSVRLAIVDAVSKVTGLGADKISVLKMK